MNAQQAKDKIKKWFDNPDIQTYQEIVSFFESGDANKFAVAQFVGECSARCVLESNTMKSLEQSAQKLGVFFQGIKSYNVTLHALKEFSLIMENTENIFHELNSKVFWVNAVAAAWKQSPTFNVETKRMLVNTISGFDDVSASNKTANKTVSTKIKEIRTKFNKTNMSATENKLN